MSDDRKKPIWPWIVALLIGLPIAYQLSLGPCVWLLQHHDVLPKPIEQWMDRTTETYAAPSNFLYDRAPRPVQTTMRRYIELWTTH